MKKLLAISLITFGISFGLAQQKDQIQKSEIKKESVKVQKNERFENMTPEQKAEWQQKRAEMRKNKMDSQKDGKNLKKGDFRKANHGKKTNRGDYSKKKHEMKDADKVKKGQKMRNKRDVESKNLKSDTDVKELRNSKSLK